MRNRRHALAWLAGLASLLAFALTPIAAALGHRGGAPTSVQVMLRCLVGAAVLLVIALASKTVRSVRPGPALGLIFVCGPVFGVQLLCYFHAVALTGAQVSTIVVHAYPMIVLLLLWIGFGRRVAQGQVLLGAVMAVGLVLVAGAGAEGVNAWGVVFALASAVGYALYFVTAERWIPQAGTFMAAALTAVGAAATTAVVVVVEDTDWSFAPLGWMSIVGQGLVLLPVGIACSFLAVRVLGSGPVSLFGLLDPVIGVVAAQVLLGESMGPIQWAGLAVALAASAALPWARGSSTVCPEEVIDTAPQVHPLLDGSVPPANSGMRTDATGRLLMDPVTTVDDRPVHVGEAFSAGPTESVCGTGEHTDLAQDSQWTTTTTARQSTTDAAQARCP